MGTIQGKIMDAHRDARSSITYGLPVNFSIPDMANTDASVIIYYTIIVELEKRGFIVNVCSMTTSETSLTISWPTQCDDKPLNDMIKYIALKRRGDVITAHVPKSRVTRAKHTITPIKNDSVYDKKNDSVSTLPSSVDVSQRTLRGRSGGGDIDDKQIPDMSDIFKDMTSTDDTYSYDYDQLI